MRVSGPDVPGIARSLLGRLPAPREATLLPFRDADGGPLDVGIALYFEAPASYTGEHVLELQGHGGPVVLDGVLARTLGLGARAARPGEFTERAFLNGRLDLVQAEAVADLIDSASGAAARAALRSLEGGLSADVVAILDELTALRVWLEAALDFSEEEIDFLAEPELGARADALHAALAATLARAGQGRRLRDGVALAIVGRPNVGKSSLLNALAGTEAAIVTDIAGTTRDLVRERMLIGGTPFDMVDTAGLRATDDPVERIGVERARAALRDADHALIVVAADDVAEALDARGADPAGSDAALARLVRTDADVDADPIVEMPAGTPAGTRAGTFGHGGADASANIEPAAPSTVLVNKLDLVPEARRADLLSRGRDGVGGCGSGLSARDGTGLEALQARLRSVAGQDDGVEGVYLARRRHLDALETARSHVGTALERLRSGVMPELAAEELRLAREALDALVGRSTADDLLGEIFGSFCIGK